MRPVSDLYGLHEGDDVYVVGTGASMRTFPLGFLEGRVTIGLNLAWRIVPVRYGLTIGPHLHVPEFLPDGETRPDMTWVTKRSKARAVLDDEQFAYADERFYGFEADGQPNTQPLEEPSDAGRVLDWVRTPTGASLYQWSSISQTAVNLAANLGAANVVLVGCDNCALLENHHADGQHTKWMGAEPDRRYQQYYDGLAEVRAALRTRGVNVVNLTPFLKLDAPDVDFQRLCDELEEPLHVAAAPDISEQDHPRRFAEQDAASRRRRPIGRRSRRR